MGYRLLYRIKYSMSLCKGNNDKHSKPVGIYFGILKASSPLQVRSTALRHTFWKPLLTLEPPHMLIQTLKEKLLRQNNLCPGKK
ncbi:hypothetical protein GDO81_010239 [Engystomops pustulosus]|uniref:Uncharacterized protein n=1 Tax=Engystomops pustulosus TaxID=76066 RepID=A0AAV7BYC5_ENGPU|nr:hypothetical protein GDO81_010239 [Engystomops pustulosus]